MYGLYTLVTHFDSLLAKVMLKSLKMGSRDWCRGLSQDNTLEHILHLIRGDVKMVLPQQMSEGKNSLIKGFGNIYTPEFCILIQRYGCSLSSF